MIMAEGTGPELIDRLHASQPELPALYISGYADLALAQVRRILDSRGGPSGSMPGRRG